MVREEYGGDKGRRYSITESDLRRWGKSSGLLGVRWTLSLLFSVS